MKRRGIGALCLAALAALLDWRLGGHWWEAIIVFYIAVAGILCLAGTTLWGAD